jgi:hypothetical protein
MQIFFINELYYALTSCIFFIFKILFLFDSLILEYYGPNLLRKITYYIYKQGYLIIFTFFQVEFFFINIFILKNFFFFLIIFNFYFIIITI